MILPHPADVVEVAVLILASFLVGACIGAALRLLVFSRQRPGLGAATGLPDATSATIGPPLVVTPAIQPVRATPLPAVPATVPEPDFSSVIGIQPARLEPLPQIATMPPLLPLPAVEHPLGIVVAAATVSPTMAPAPAAGQSTSGPLVPVADLAVDSGDTVTTEVVPPRETGPASVPPPADVWDVPAEPQWTLQPASPPPPEATHQPPELLPQPPEASPPPPDFDERPAEEEAAMRAIEGGWTPRGAADPASPAELPELSAEDAVLASRNAVRAAGAATMALLQPVRPTPEPQNAAEKPDEPAAAAFEPEPARQASG